MTVPRLPRVLDANMRETARLRPSRLNVEPHGDTLSTASMSLPPGEPRVPLRAWVELYTAQGSAGVYRVASRKEDFGTETRLTLRHGLCSLEDCVLPGEGTLTGPAGEVFAAILGAQNLVMWALGDVADTPTVTVEYGGSNALELLQDALDQLPDYALTFDQSALPWKLGLARMADGDGAEARLSRNVKSVSVEEDDGELCTRVYVDGREGYTDGPTAAEYGAIERVLTVPDGASDDEVAAYVSAYLDQHARPARSLTIDAYDLSRETGEDLDAFRVSKRVRVPLPAYGETPRERISAMTYPDVFGDPQNVRVTASARENDLSDMLSGLERSASDAAALSNTVSRNSKQIQENITKLSDTYTELVKWGEQTATRFNEVQITLDAQKAEIDLKASSTDVSALGSRVSQAEIDISGLDAKITLQASRTDTLEGTVSEAQLAIDGANAAITANASRLDEQAKTLTEAGLAIDGVKGEVALKASQSSVDDLGNRVTQAEAEITVNKDQINLRVKAGDIASSINQTAQSVKISASKIELSGYVTADELSAELANIEKFYNGESYMTAINVSGRAAVGSLTIGQNSVHTKQIDIVTEVTITTASEAASYIDNINLETNYVHYANKRFLTSAKLDVTTSKIYYWSWE